MKIASGEFHRGAYPAMFAGWSVKLMGTPVTDELLQTMHVLCARPGSKHAVACAMMARPGEGATDEQIWHATQLIKFADGTPQKLHNYRDQICGRNGAPMYFTRVTVRNHNQLTITPLGQKVLAERLGGTVSQANSKAKALADKHNAKLATEKASKAAAAKAKAKATREAKRAAKQAQLDRDARVEAAIADGVDNTVTLPPTE